MYWGYLQSKLNFLDKIVKLQKSVSRGKLRILRLNSWRDFEATWLQTSSYSPKHWRGILNLETYNRRKKPALTKNTIKIMTLGFYAIYQASYFSLWFGLMGPTMDRLINAIFHEKCTMSSFVGSFRIDECLCYSGFRYFS